MKDYEELKPSKILLYLSVFLLSFLIFISIIGSTYLVRIYWINFIVNLVLKNTVNIIVISILILTLYFIKKKIIDKKITDYERKLKNNGHRK